jgi:hypothetical protein
MKSQKLNLQGSYSICHRFDEKSKERFSKEQTCPVEKGSICDFSENISK